MNHELVANRLKKLRKQASLSQAEAARRLSIGQSLLSMYESGERFPSDQAKVKFSKLYDASIQSIFFDE